MYLIEFNLLYSLNTPQVLNSCITIVFQQTHPSTALEDMPFKEYHFIIIIEASFLIITHL